MADSTSASASPLQIVFVLVSPRKVALRTSATTSSRYIWRIKQSDKYSYSHIGKFLTVGNKPVIKFVIETVKYFFRNIESMFLAFISKDIRNDILMAWAILGIVNRINLMCRYLLNGLGSIISNDGKFLKMNIQNDTEITYDRVVPEYIYSPVLQQFLATLLPYYHGIITILTIPGG